MEIRIAAAIALFLGAVGFGIAGTIVAFQIIDAVNARLPKHEQFEPLGWYPTKRLRLYSEYRRLYPGGRLLQRQRVLAAVMLLCLILAVVLIGVIRA